MNRIARSMPQWPAFILAGAAAACAYPAITTPTPDAGPAPYRALGTEPFWSVTIADGRMVYDTPDGVAVDVPAPAPRRTATGLRYETSRLTLDVMPGECSDGMSDRLYADTVRVTANGRTLSGCGGAIQAPESLASTNWSITAIDGAPIPASPDYFLAFENDRLSGRAGCNRFSGSYAVAGDTLTPGAIAATRMACPGPRDAHERAMLDLLAGPARLSLDGETLTLTRANRTIVLRRAI